ncbi:ABC transporter permease [Virgibacillus kekensis]|uniref:ABC transporter permease n=1 Tax=Virgibacillus kekensis TaxID=202261 RepID=A0ABV9DKC9_9BACI
MLSLIKNEVGKIFHKKANWIYILVVVVALIGAGLIQQSVTDEPSENWREQTKTEINRLQTELEKAPNDAQGFIKEEIARNQMLLDEDINPNAYTNWDYMNEIVIGVTMLVTLFSVIVSSAIVSSEFSAGTIKQLLIRPHPRWIILLSKYIALVAYSLVLLITVIAVGYILGVLMFETGDFSAKILEPGLEGEKIATVGSQFLWKLVYYLPSLIIIITISFMLSTLFKSQALAVGFGIFVLFVSSTLGGIIIVLAEKFEWVKFLIFPHLDLTIYATQDTILGGVTPTISLLILCVYYIIFMAVTFAYFQKRDISI